MATKKKPVKKAPTKKRAKAKTPKQEPATVEEGNLVLNFAGATIVLTEKVDLRAIRDNLNARDLD